MKLTIKGTEKRKYLVVLEGEEALTIDIWWSVDLPNNPSYDGILAEWMTDNYGYRAYEYFCINELSHYQAGAIG